MSSSGYMLRKAQAQAERSAAPCPSCGHPHSQHLEYPPSYELVDGEIRETEHPLYRPGLFACRVDGCDCTIDHSKEAS